MRNWNRMIIFVVAAVLTLMLASCSSRTRTPEQWLSLSYAGLTSVDQFKYVGSLRMFSDNGIDFAPQTFEGKVMAHKQLNVQTSGENPVLMNPIKALERLSRAGSGSKVSIKEKTANTVTLLITENSEEARSEWTDLLTQRMDQLADKGPIKTGAYKEEWDRELAASRAKLDEMLKSLSAETSYELVIDSNRILPLKLDERTTLTYNYKGKGRSENRQTVVNFQSFDGSAGKAVQ